MILCWQLQNHVWRICQEATEKYHAREICCTIDHKMERSLWQTFMSFDLLHSSYMWIQTILSCGKYCKTMQTGTVSRLRFCRRSWGLKIHFWRSIVRFGKSYICSNKLDVSETNFSFAQFNRIRNHFFGRSIKVGRYYSRLIYGVWSSQCFTEMRIRLIKNGETRTNFQRERNFMEWLIEAMLILFPQTCILLVRKLYCISLKTTKQWSRWS